MELLLILLDSIEFLGAPIFDSENFWKLITKTVFNLIIITTIIRYIYYPVTKNKDYLFGHGTKYQLPDKKILIGCYHPSPRNVNTKRINLSMMVKLLKNTKKIII